MKEQRKKIIKNKLHQDLGSELDIELAWSEFKQKKRKKRFVFWWPALGGLLMIAGFIFVNSWIRSVDAEKQISQTMASQKSIEIAKSPLPTNSLKKTEINNQTSTTLKGEGAEKSITKIINTKPKIADHKTSQLNNFDLNSTSNPSQKTKTYSEDPNIQLNPITKTNSTAPFIKEQKSAQKIAATNSLLLRNSLKSTKKSPPLVTEIRMLLIPFPLLKIKTFEPPSLLMPKPIGPKFWELGIAYQYSKAGRKIDGENIAYLDRRNANEDFLEANHLALSLQRKLNDRFYLQSGIHLGRYRTKLVDQYQIFEPKVFDNQVIEIIQNGLQEERVLGSVTGTQTKKHTNTRFQQYLEISLPIQLGWQIPLNRALSIDLMAGARFSVWNKSTGNTFESATSIGNYQKTSDLGYKKAGIITGVSSLFLSQQVGNGIRISAGIQANYDFTNRLSGNSESDKFYGYGLQIGLLKQLRF